MSDDAVVFLTLIIVIVLIFNIVLFFKIWGMTNDIKALTRFKFIKEGIKNGYLTEAEILDEVVGNEILRQRARGLERMERPTKPKTEEEIAKEEAEKKNKKGFFQKFSAAKNEEN